MKIEEYIKKADNVQLHNCICLLLQKQKIPWYQRVGKKGTLTRAYFQAKAYLKTLDHQTIVNIWIYLNEVETPAYLFDLVKVSKEFIREKQLQEESEKQASLNTGNHTYDLGAFLND